MNDSDRNSAGVTGDGRRDIVLAGYSIGYLPAVGPGLAFGEMVLIDELPRDRWVPSIAAVDVDSDFDDDLVAYEFAQYLPAERRIRVYLNEGGIFTSSATFPVSSFQDARIFAGDFNGDGHADIVFAGLGQASARLFTGQGTGAFTESIVTGNPIFW